MLTIDTLLSLHRCESCVKAHGKSQWRQHGIRGVPQRVFSINDSENSGRDKGITASTAGARHSCSTKLYFTVVLSVTNKKPIPLPIMFNACKIIFTIQLI